ncbi:MAG: tetratricopeptide repeat protein [Deltaproteobacteria bacterium]|nr:tetratricopeptide repeat protein [Deltaproteobacteria bacterium]
MRLILVAAILILAAPTTVGANTLDPYIDSSPAFARAESAVRSGRVDQAVRLFETAADQGRTSPRREALDYRIGRLLEKKGRLKEALERYGTLATGVLSDPALYREGLVRLRLGDVTRARIAFAQVSRSSSHWIDARLALSAALVDEGRPSLARAVLKELFVTDLGGHDLHRTRLALARVLQASGQIDAAVACARGAYLAASGDARARSAGARLVELGKRPSRLLKKLRQVVHAKGKSLRRLAKWARKKHKTLRKMDPGLRFFILGRHALRGRRDMKRAVDYLQKSSDRARNPSLKAQALFSLAHALTRTGDDDEANRLFRQLVDEFPSSPVAAKAAVSSAQSLMRLGDHEGALLVLKRVSTEFPESGLGNRALWQMAFAGIMSGRPESALPHLDETAARLDHGEGVLFGLAEKVRYFRGVVLQDLGRTEEAVTELDRVARSFPHSYYGVLAVSRLAGLAPDKAAFVQGTSGPRLTMVPVDTPGFTRRSAATAPRFEATDQPLDSDEAIIGPVMLWKLGYRKEAVRELKARASQGHLHENALVVLAALVSHGRSPQAAMFGQRYIRGWPTKRSRKTFAAAYPRPFTNHVIETSGLSGVDPAFIYGVMRTESRFNPRARSGAGAIGMMQLMPRTARELADKLLGDRGLARRLRSPGPNIRLGTTFLAELRRHFRGHLALVLAGYNAGPGAARSFHRHMKHLPTDVFVEAVPYAQTMAFIKRVVGYAAGYRALYDDEGRGPFLLSQALPDSLGPFMQPR